MGVVPLVELAERARFAPEELHDRHPRDVLLKERVDARDALADQAIGLPRPDPEEVDRQGHDRHQRKRDERELDVEVKEDRHDARERETVHGDGQRTRGEHLVHHVDVGRHARDEPPDRVPVEIRHRQPLQVSEHLHAEVGERALGDEHGQIVVAVEGTEFHERGEHEEHRHPRETGEILGGHVAVDGDLQEIGLHQQRERGDEQADEREQERPPVRADVSQ